MQESDLVNKIKEIQLKAKYLVTEVLAGEYESAFRGQGMEFAEVREYTPGDDIRAIDWNVTARMDIPFIKEFNEERELTMFILVDLSSSQEFGSVNSIKHDLNHGMLFQVIPAEFRLAIIKGFFSDCYN